MTRRRKQIVVGSALFASLAAYGVWVFLAGPILIVHQIEKSNSRIVDWFCRSGVSPNRDAWMVGGVFHCAVASGNQEIVKMMIAHHADVNRIDGYGTTPIHVATSRGDVDMMQLLVNRGSDITKRNRNGETALDIAISEKLEVARKLLEHTAQKPATTN